MPRNFDDMTIYHGAKRPCDPIALCEESSRVSGMEAAD